MVYIYKLANKLFVLSSEDCVKLVAGTKMTAQSPRIIMPRLAAALNALHPRLHSTSQGLQALEQQKVRCCHS